MNVDAIPGVIHFRAFPPPLTEFSIHALKRKLELWFKFSFKTVNFPNTLTLALRSYQKLDRRNSASHTNQSSFQDIKPLWNSRILSL